MKVFLTTVLFFCITNSLCAIEKRTYTQFNSSEARIFIDTGNEANIQASTYVDALENHTFIRQLLSDPKSKLYQLKLSIEKENCNQIAECGDVTITTEVRTSFGRGGWDTAGASYIFFVGFTNVGSGKYFDVSRMVTLSETVEAQTNKDGTYKGTIIKTLQLGQIKKIDENIPLQ
jgi:hypothetical protein